MKIVISALLILVGLIVVVYLIGLSLPKEITVVKETVFSASPKQVYEIITDNSNWTYRSSVTDLKVISENKGFEEWIETSADGNVIHFKTKEKIPYSFYSFEMQGKLFDGNWTGEFIEAEEGKTLFIATENIIVRNPIFKVVSYFAMDIEKMMLDYQNDVSQEIMKRYGEKNIPQRSELNK